ncbi:MAG: ribonuclease PH [Candidatus Omnitrophica bacterium]|nr:ribonuclease PH [Candidatus Omnitrophota bacterium]MDD5311370.1 ribonuclease PH [Candidatus Omnitrophota bacterium]MDD5546856.1 ribonuclease PH [Candidatus Omnitrophota bacterium]
MIKRADGRGAEFLRKVNVTRNYMKFAEGSCLMELGETKVICTASVEENVPMFLKGKGTGWVTSEYGMLPRSCQQRVQREAVRGAIGGRTHEIQRLVGRSLRAVVDLPVLGERSVWIDCDVIQADGGTRCASITGSFIALADALSWMKKKGMITKIPVLDYVAATSVGMIKGEPVLDLTFQEDSNADVDMNIVMTGGVKFIEVQGTAEGEPFDGEELHKLLELAKKGIGQLIDIQKKALGI